MADWNYDAMESGYLDNQGRIQVQEPTESVKVKYNSRAYWALKVTEQAKWIERCIQDKTSSYYGKGGLEVKRADHNEWQKMVRNYREACRNERGIENGR